jgi:hypothetical protein
VRCGVSSGCLSLHVLAVMHFVFDAERLLRFAVFPVLLSDDAFGLRKPFGGKGM